MFDGPLGDEQARWSGLRSQQACLCASWPPASAPPQPESHLPPILTLVASSIAVSGLGVEDAERLTDWAWLADEVWAPASYRAIRRR